MLLPVKTMQKVSTPIDSLKNGVKFCWHRSPDYGNLLPEWNELLKRSKNLNVLYQSPEWFGHLLNTEADDHLHLGLAKDADGKLLGVLPLKVGTFPLNFEVSARSLFKIPFKSTFLLGSQPLLADNESIYDEVLNEIEKSFSDCTCIYIDSLTKDSFFWRYLKSSSKVKNQYWVYLPEGFRPFHYLELNKTFEDFLSKFKSKKRGNLRRQLKNLQEFGQTDIELRCIRLKEQIPEFLKAAESIAGKSWQSRRIGPRIKNDIVYNQKLTDLADRGILRSYLLVCGVPCAFIIGYQFCGVYHYVEIAYDQKFYEHSPGTALLYLMVEDLFRSDSPQWLNFGIGDAHYKQEFSNQHAEDASILLLRKNLHNRSVMLLHCLFYSLKKIVKKILYKI